MLFVHILSGSNPKVYFLQCLYNFTKATLQIESSLGEISKVYQVHFPEAYETTAPLVHANLARL